MIWVGVDVGLAVLGLAVLALLGFRLFREVRALGRDVSAAARRIGEARARLQRAPEGRVDAVASAPGRGRPT